MKFRKTIISVAMLLFVVACKPPSKVPDLSFYHWQSYWDITEAEFAYMDSLDVQRLYVRYFDVDVQAGEIVPVGKLLEKVDYRYPQEVIPTIFITNRTFRHLPIGELDDLVAKIANLIEIIHPKVSAQAVKEVQFDCDWTDGTKDAYFNFLKKIEKKKKGAWKISATIRLHQVKYKKRTGVPPTTGRNVLMCYNTGELDNPHETNSILNPQIVEQYIADIAGYPKGLDVALPLFSWGVLIRQGKVIKLIRNVDKHTFDNRSQFKRTGNLVEVLKGTYLNAHYLYEGDRLRLEGTSKAKLRQTARLLQQYNTQPQQVIFYHLDSIIIKQYHHEELENIARQFTY